MRALKAHGRAQLTLEARGISTSLEVQLSSPFQGAVRTVYSDAPKRACVMLFATQTQTSVDVRLIATMRS